MYGERVESFHDAVQSAPAGVGSSAGGDEAGVSDDAESVDANAVAARKGRRARSFILLGLLGLRVD